MAVALPLVDRAGCGGRYGTRVGAEVGLTGKGQSMSVRVRLFAAVREAAGTDQTTAEAGPLPVVLAQLRDRYGEHFSARLDVCSVLVDGRAVPSDAAIEVPDGAEVVVLPPFSGGSLHLRP